MPKKIALIIQARMSSTRLPGKVLMPVLGKPMLEFQIERLRRVKLTQQLILATTTKVEDEPLVRFAQKMGIICTRGPEQDVLKRYFQAAAACGADDIVRVTSDCPLIEPSVIDSVIELYNQEGSDFDYVSNTLQRTFPRGLDTEIFSFKNLAIADSEAKKASEREHVTPFFYNNPKRFKIGQFRYREDQHQHRWTLDTQEDFELLSKILTRLYPQKPEFCMEDVLELMNNNPEWVKINQHVEQKQH